MGERGERRAMDASPGGWGEVGASTMTRYSLPTPRLPHGKGRRRCRCGCGGWATHTGCANGMALMSGCELTVARWVRDGDDFLRRDAGSGTP